MSCTRIPLLAWVVTFSLLAPAHAQFTEPDATLVDTLDPTFQEMFGTSVAVAGDYVFCHSVADFGAPPGFGPNSVHVFRRGPVGWTFVQRLRTFRPMGAGSTWAFGRSMIAYDDRLLVGALGASAPERASGLVACYRRINGRYELEQVISDGPGYGEAYNLGRAMVLHAGELFVSAAGADIPGNSMGKILRFEDVGGQWVFAEEIIPPSGQYLRVGTGLCFDEDRLIATTQVFDAIVFQRQGGQWVHTQTFVRQFHFDVPGLAGGGGWLHFADANMAVGGTGLKPGVVTEFRWNGAEYIFQRAILATNPAQIGIIGDRFGYSIARDGNKIIVGALSATTDGIHREGGAYLLELVNGQWVETERFVPSQAGVPGEFHTGISVAIQDDTVVVGSQFFDLAGDGQLNAGAAFVYDRPFGADVCQGLANSTGLPATLEVRGNRSAAAGAVRLELFQLPPNAFALFFAGRAAGFVAMPAGSSGNLCISGVAGRFGAAQATPGGTAQWVLDTSSLPPQIGGALQSGDMLVFQAWYRDANPAVTSNFTGAVEVTFR